MIYIYLKINIKIMSVISMKDVKNHVHRDGFDLSRKNAFTAKLGELLPVMCEDVAPGDNFRVSADWFTRTQPVTAPAYTRFSEYYDFFFVPYHLLWRYAPMMFIQTNDDHWSTGLTNGSKSFNSHPYISSKELFSFFRGLTYHSSGSEPAVVNKINRFGFAESYGSLKLMEYLDYGLGYRTNSNGVDGVGESYYNYLADTALNPFPFAAYQKIYFDFYRNTQWENPNPNCYNFDYLTSTLKVPLNQLYSGAGSTAILNEAGKLFGSNGLFTLRYCNFNKDYFTGRLPQKQYGTEALASPLTVDGQTLQSYLGVGGSASLLGFCPTKEDNYIEVGNNLSNNGAVTSGIGALAIRTAQYLQKWKEITQSGGTDYVSQVSKHFGVTPNKIMAHQCTYLGGFSKKFGIDEVTNTNLTSGNEAIIFGKGVNAGHGNIDFEAKEHGLLMCVYHVSLLPEYSSLATERLNVKTTAQDYIIPELDNVGMQDVKFGEFYGFNTPRINTEVQLQNPLGYVPRYAEYKTRVDKIRGAFASSLTNWVTPLNTVGKKEVPTSVSDWFYKVNPKFLDSVFSVSVDSTIDTDQFLVNCQFGVNAVRNISRDGLPY